LHAELGNDAGESRFLILQRLQRARRAQIHRAMLSLPRVARAPSLISCAVHIACLIPAGTSLKFPMICSLLNGTASFVRLLLTVPSFTFNTNVPMRFGLNSIESR
jgi:hypothetical protein